MKLSIIFLTLLTLISSTIVCMEEENDSELNAALALSLQTPSNSNNNNNTNGSINHFDSLPDELVLKIANEVGEVDNITSENYKGAAHKIAAFLRSCKRFSQFKPDIAQSYIKRRIPFLAREQAAARLNIPFVIQEYLDNNPDNKSYKNSLLQTAAESHSVETAKLLLKQHADVNSQDSEGLTPLMLAIQYLINPLEIIKLLVEDFGADINQQDKDGYTALTYTVLFGWSPEPIQFLLAHGADVNMVDNANNNVLDIAEVISDREVLQLLRQYATEE